MLRYLNGDIEIPELAIPMVIDDVNNGNLTSIVQVNERRAQTAESLRTADNIILKISSLKRIEIHSTNFEKPLFANITSLSNLNKEFVLPILLISRLPCRHTRIFDG